MIDDFAFHLEDAPATRPAAAAPLSDAASLRDSLRDEDRRRILDALARNQGNQQSAAKVLGMPRRILVERLRTYGVTRGRKPAPEADRD